MADPVRVGVVGCGWWATRAHLPTIASHPDAELAAIADTSTSNLSRAASIFQPEAVFSDAEEMLLSSDLDAVIVATPHAHHFRPAALALSRGINTLVEKPMVLDPDEGARLLALAEANGCELIVGYPWHYTPQVIELKERIASGSIGAIEHVSATYASTARELYRGHPDAYRDLLGYPVNAPNAATYSNVEIAGGGQGQTQLTHSAALCLHLTGLHITQVRAFTASFELEVDLADAVIVRFENGATGAFDTVGNVQPGQDEICQVRIFGSDGHILLDAIHGTASIHTHNGRVDQLRSLSAADCYPEAAPAYNLIDVTAGRATNGSPGRIGQDVVELISAMYASARQDDVAGVQ